MVLQIFLVIFLFFYLTVYLQLFLKQYKNRAELKAVIESRGGKVKDSITSLTSYLINNDINSTSSKNKKAKELQVPIITEEEFTNIFDI